MEILRDEQRRDAFQIKFQKRVLRCDLQFRCIDVLNPHDFMHKKALDANKYIDVENYDKEELISGFFRLLDYFTLDPGRIKNAQPHDLNGRYALIGSDDKMIEIDKDLTGLKDYSGQVFGRGHYKKTKSQIYHNSRIVNEYLRILKEIKRMAEFTQQVAIRQRKDLF